MVSLVRMDRAPLWSGVLTRPLARWIPPGARPAALAAVKGIHTLAFFSIAASILLFLADGLRGQPTRRSAIAMAVGMGESALYVSNNQVCPLTPLAEELGAERGSVVDIYLPGWLNRRIPLLGGSALLLALAANAVALARNRPR